VRALQIAELNGPDGLELVDVDEPSADGVVVIDVHAAGVAFPDLLMTRGLYQVKPPLPFVPGVEVGGTVRSAPGGSGLATGDRVCAVTMLGGLAEVALAPAALTWKLPDNVTFEAGAALTMNYGTAHFGLVRRGRLKEGETVLVHGASGGVGTAIIDLAGALGARTIAVATGAEKLEVARSAGADELVDASGDWLAEVKSLTGGRGADIVADPVGGERFHQSVRALAPEGRLLVIGFAAGEIPEVAVNRLLLKNIDVVGVNWGGMVMPNPSAFHSVGEELMRIAAEGRLDPPIGGRYALADGAQAFRDLDERRATGKLVVVVRD
jgi:NADPH2:quinone reductase